MKQRLLNTRQIWRKHTYDILRRWPLLGKVYLRVRKLRHNAFTWWCLNDRKYRWKWRITNGLLAILFLASAMVPILQQVWQQSRYKLNNDSIRLVGKTDKSLAKQLTYDSQKKQYVFNKDAIVTGQDSGMPKALQKAAVGAKDKSNTKTYALEVPQDFKKGVTYHDSNSQLSFSMAPDFSAMDGKIEQGHLVFPLASGNQAIYTLKNNGLKEDIVVPKVTQPSMNFRYTLNVPSTMQVKVIPNGDGAVGIYSASPSLFGDISFGSDKDRALLEKARVNADKTQLVFGLPAPVVKGIDGLPVPGAAARFELSGTKLTVVVDGLKDTGSPITIDPSVVVTSTSDFVAGGNVEDGNIDFDTSGQITRGKITGGSLGTWGATTSLPYATEHTGNTIYNGYIYAIGGSIRSPTTGYATVSYAPLNSNGTVGTWATTTSLPNQCGSQVVVAYNGYMYNITGINLVNVTDSLYAPINSDGTLGTWATTTSLPVALRSAASAVWAGYVYVLGGAATGTTGSEVSTVYYAPLNADGTIGTWATTTALSYGRTNIQSNVYNGYVYIFGGSSSSAYVADVQYAKIKADGTLGSWITTNSFSTARYGHVSGMYHGYAYIMGGVSGSYLNDTQYAQINADGSLGQWYTSTSFTTARPYAIGGFYNGYAYLGTGYQGSNVDMSDMQYVKINNAGWLNNYNVSSKNTTANVTGAGSAIYNGYFYSVGGFNLGASRSEVRYAAINADGSLGSWVNATNALPTPVTAVGLAVYNGYIYALGGLITSGTARTDIVQYALLYPDGSTAAFSTTTSMPNTYAAGQAVAYNNYIYYIGGQNGTRSASSYYAPINSDGTIGTWGSTSSLNSVTQKGSISISNGYIYLVGGTDNSTTATSYNNAEYAKINSDGTLGTWTNSSSTFSTGRFNLQSFTAGGYLYAIGGQDGTTQYANVDYAVINSDGSLGTWQTNASLPQTYTNFSGAYSGGKYYMQNGVYGGTYVKTGLIVDVSDGGSGATGSWTTNTNSLSSIYTTGTAYGRSFAYNGYLYEIGGVDSSNTPLNTTAYAAINDDGTIGTWTTTTSLTTNRIQFGLAVANGYVYVVGGQTNAGVSLSSTDYAPINSNGTLGSWSSTSSIAAATTHLVADSYNGYIYAAGGKVGGSPVTTMQYAAINSNGTLGSWTATTSFTGARSQHQMITYGGFIYILGGDNGSTPSSLTDVQYAPLNASSGAVGTWKYTTAMTSARKGFLADVNNGYIYVWGGFSGSTQPGVYTEVQYSTIKTDGTIGGWMNAQGSGFSATSQRQFPSGTVYGGKMYLMGGVDGGTYNNDVQYAQLNVQPRKATYSKLIDLGSNVNVTGASYNGTLPVGVSALSYRVAGSNGVFGAVNPLANIIGAGGCQGTTVNKRYLMFTVQFDDTNAAGYADVSNSPSSLTDFTVNYNQAHPDPSIRLRMGQTLQAGTLSPFDTCS